MVVFSTSGIGRSKRLFERPKLGRSEADDGRLRSTPVLPFGAPPPQRPLPKWNRHSHLRVGSQFIDWSVHRGISRFFTNVGFRDLVEALTLVTELAPR